jgi:predicted Rossmann fold nucleotide-binding protein DprA/Smf involved in DNA uptake
VAEILGFTVNSQSSQKPEDLERRMLELIGSEPIFPEFLLERLSVPPGRLQQLIFDLEKKGLLQELAGGRVIRSVEGSEELWRK